MKTFRPGPLFPLFLLLMGTVLLLPSFGPAGAATPPTVSIYFETQLPYFYAGDELTVAITVKNLSETPVEDLDQLDLAKGIRVEDARGAKLKMVSDAKLDLPKPSSLPPSAFFGRIFRLEELFPDLQNPGNYRLAWKGRGATSNSLVLRVVERYEYDRDYQARIDTDFGPIVIEFAKETAPRHVRNFIDLARQGFYDGNQFHRIVKGQAIIGGSPTGDPAAGTGYNLEPELADLPVEPGTVVQVRNRETGADDSGSHFMIVAIAKPDLRRRLTVLGKVVEGLDTVKTICQVPTLRKKEARIGTPGPPVKPVLMRKVTIVDVTEKKEDSTARADSSS